MKNLVGRNIVITGAAKGIGREMALLFAQEKSNLAIVDINMDELNKTAIELEQCGVRVSSYKCDVSKRDEIEKICEKIQNDFDKIDILINNAGIVVGKPIIDSSYDDIKRTIDINLMGVIWMIKQFLPDMISRNDGHIVNVASAAGLMAIPGLADYCATKFGVIGYTDALRMEMKKYGHHGVKTTCICPSAIDTGMFDGFKPPLLNPILKQEMVAKKIVATIKKEHTYLKIPFMMKLAPMFKLFPATFADWLCKLSGTEQTMDHFKGH